MNYLIIGSTGSLGQQVISELYDYHQITVLSRDELKQKQIKDKYPNLKCVIGDIKDLSSIINSFAQQDRVLNFAALKHVDICEQNVEECIKTNLLGAMNVAKAAMMQGVKRCLFTSTDKAVLPITAYGYAKALATNYMSTHEYCLRSDNCIQFTDHELETVLLPIVEACK
jgi:UDP-N-acetylglucosamine 4,6-dehydratase